MIQENVLENIKAGLDHVDAAALQSIWEIISHSAPRANNRSADIGQSALQRAIISEPLSRFVGENLTLEEYERLSPKERGMLQRRLKERNHLWLQEKFSTMKAAWLIVIDGQVIDSGKSLQNEPMPPQILEICGRTGKFPFIFINSDTTQIGSIFKKASWRKLAQCY